MQIHNVVQGSDEWLALRAKYFTASEAPAMMGVSKYQSRTDLLKAKALGVTQEVDANTQALFDRGHAAEAGARSIAEKILGEDLFSATVTAKIDGLMLLASLDGMTMDGSTLWEHKLWSESLAAQVRDGALDPHYTVQMDHQMLVTGAARVMFMCSDGTEENCVWMWYERQAMSDHIIAGWHQFVSDLSEYQHVEDAPAAVGKAPDSLPALRIELTGMVTASNLTEFRQAAMTVIDAVNTDLQTDEDFASAEKAVKWAKDVEDRLEAAKQNALSQTASIEDLFRTIDEIKGYAREKRLHLEKLVKARKEALRAEILAAGKQALADHIAKLEKRIKPLRMPAYAADFAGAMKSKRTIASLRDAVDTLLSQAKIATNQIADDIEANLRTLDELAADYRHLFADLQQIAVKPSDDFVAVVKLRIAQYQEAEAKRIEAEREKIRAEETARVEREERARIRAEQEAKEKADSDLAIEQRGKAADATHGEPRATVSPRAPAASTSPIKPTDRQIVETLKLHYDVDGATIIKWLQSMDFSTLRDEV